MAEVAATGLLRTAFFDAIEDVFESYDLLVTPTLGIDGVGVERDAIRSWSLALAWPFNWTDHAAASIPAGEGERGRRIGRRLVDPQYADERMWGREPRSSESGPGGTDTTG